MTRILVTNDDGIHSDGLIKLEEALKKLGDCYVVAPASVMVRRSVIEDVGAFDPDLRTAEDIEFHLRVARRHGVGLVPEPLVR